MRLLNINSWKILNAGIFLLLLGFISILPFLVLAYFNQPSADDFYYNTASQNLSYLETQIKLFTNLNGRYTTSAILSIPELLSNNLFFYKLIPIILIAIFFYSFYYLVSSLALNLKRRDYFILSLLCLSIYIIKMPSIAQGFYWLSSSVAYQLSCVLVLLFFSLIVKLFSFNNIKHLIISVFLLIAIIGSNEISMLITDFLLGIIFVFYLFKNKKLNYNLLILLFVAFVFSFIVIKSPGNSVRGTNFPNKHMFFYSIYKTLNILKSYLIIWLPSMIVFILIFYDHLNKNKNIKASKIFDVHPFLVFSVSISVVFIGFFTGYWAMGSLLPPRSMNLIFFFFILTFMYFTLIMFFYLKKKNKDFITYSPYVRYFLFICLILILVQKNNVKTAYSDLITGKAYKYDLELKKRSQLIKKSEADTVYVSNLNYKPKTIFNEDITSNNQDWRNGCYNAYYQKTIILKN